MVSRLKSKKHPAVSIMLDAQREGYLSRERVLNPKLFNPSKQHQRYFERFSTHPGYLAQCATFVTNRSSEVKKSLNQMELNTLVDFIECNGPVRLEDSSNRVFYSRFTMNGITIRTLEFEKTIKTSDSVVCGRFGDGMDIDDEEIEDDLFFGYVRHILRSRDGDDVLVNVCWFNHSGDRIDDDQRSGLSPIACRLEPPHIDETIDGWINASSLVLTQHIVIGKMSTRVDFYVVVKI